MFRAVSSFSIRRYGVQTAFRRKPLVRVSVAKEETPRSLVFNYLRIEARTLCAASVSYKDTSSHESSTIRKRVESKRNVHWENMLAELSQYREEHGDTLVPMEYDLNPRLGTWVDTQRQNYKFYQQRKKSLLTEERISMLEREGMIWDVHENNWETRYQELVAYKSKHGDCNPPQAEEYAELWTWVFVQRRMYSIRSAGQPSSMSDKRIEALEKLDFVFNMHEAIWNQRILELKEYKRNFGDCLVPKTFLPNPTLAKWVDQQRTQYKYLQDGQRSHLTTERIKLLEYVGFVWNVHRYRWNIRLQELELFFEMNGHTKVPSKGNNNTLVNWIRRQKSEYNKYVNGEKAQLDEERVLLLRSAGLALDF